MMAHVCTPNVEAVAAYGGWPDSGSRSSNEAGQAVYGGTWGQAPQPHEVPSARLGRGQWHQSVRLGTSTENQLEASGRWALGTSSERYQRTDWGNQEQTTEAFPARDAGRPTIPKQGTTLIVWHLPDTLNLAGVLKLWPVDGTFNYLEVPFSASEKCHKGRALVNFVSRKVAMRFMTRWNGQWVHRSQQEPLEIRVANLQRLRNLLPRFQNKDIEKLDRHGCLPLICDGMRRLNTKDVLTMLFF